MATATLKIRDTADGRVSVSIEFDPPVGKNDDEVSPAQQLGMFALRAIAETETDEEREG